MGGLDEGAKGAGMLSTVILQMSQCLLLPVPDRKRGQEEENKKRHCFLLGRSNLARGGKWVDAVQIRSIWLFCFRNTILSDVCTHANDMLSALSCSSFYLFATAASAGSGMMMGG